jgi:leucyl aminopeptidase (aminopeptidase T)
MSFAADTPAAILAAAAGVHLDAPPSSRALAGVDQLLSSYLELRPDDSLVIAYSPEARHCASWIAAGASLRSVPVETFCFDHRDDVLFEDTAATAIARARSRGGSARCALLVCEVDTVSFTRALKRLRRATSASTLLLTRLTNCVPDLFELAFGVSSDRLRGINATVLAALRGRSHVRVTSNAGTDLSVTLDPTRRWVSNYGVGKPGELIVLPPGEVNTIPVDVNGVLVADGALNVNLVLGPDFDARLSTHPLTLRFEGSVIVQVDCRDARLVAFLETLFQESSLRIVGEFGIGTNVGIDRFTRLNSHINERHAGVHIGFGEQVQPVRPGHLSAVHVDAIFAGARLEFGDGRVLSTDALAPGGHEHPLDTLGEDTEHHDEDEAAS